MLKSPGKYFIAVSSRAFGVPSPIVATSSCAYLCARVCLSLTDSEIRGSSSSSSLKSPSAARLNAVAASQSPPPLAPVDARVAKPRSLPQPAPPNGGEFSPTRRCEGEGLRVSTHGRRAQPAVNKYFEVLRSFDLFGACSKDKYNPELSTFEQTTRGCKDWHAVRGHRATDGQRYMFVCGTRSPAVFCVAGVFC